MYDAETPPASDLEPPATLQHDAHPTADPTPHYDGSMYLVGYAVAAVFGAMIGFALGANL
jgi:hypothetical protein